MNGETILLRHVHPGFIQDGRATSQAFCPTAKDNSRLSVYDNSLISLSESMEHYTVKQQFASHGILGVSVNECHQESLKTEPDPEPFPSHAVIDFQPLSANQCKTKSKKLQAHALKRNWLLLNESE